MAPLGWLPGIPVGCLLQEAGCRRQDAGGRMQEAGGRRQDAGCRGQDAGGRKTRHIMKGNIVKNLSMKNTKMY